MKRLPSALLLLAGFGAPFAAPAVIGATVAPGITGNKPTPVPLSRYVAMIEKSPFAPATPGAPSPGTTARSFAKDLYVSGMAQLGNRDFVTISSRSDKQRRFSLFVGESFGGITLSGVDWSPDMGKSRVTLKKGNEFEIIGFDQAAMKPAPPASAQALPPGPGKIRQRRTHPMVSSKSPARIQPAAQWHTRQRPIAVQPE